MTHHCHLLSLFHFLFRFAYKFNSHFLMTFYYHFTAAMIDVRSVLIFCNIVLLLLIVIASSIHFFPVLLTRRFQHANNLLILNLCIASICCCLYWIAFYFVLHYAPDYLYSDPFCTWRLYVQAMTVCQVIYSFSIISIHRYCLIVHPAKQYFKSKRWLRLSISVQWVVGFIVASPMFARNHLPVSVNKSDLFSSTTSKCSSTKEDLFASDTAALLSEIENHAQLSL